MRARTLSPLLALALAVVVAGCGSTDEGSAARAQVVVTTSVLGDVVGEVVGDAAHVTVLMPAGADPHEVQLSARQVNELRSADAVIANGAGFEAGLLDALEAAAADGVPVHDAIDGVSTLELAGPHDHDHDEEVEADGHEGEVDADHGDEADTGAHEGEVDADHGDEADTGAHEGEAEADHAEEPDTDAHEGDEAGEGDEGDDHLHGTGDVDPHFFADPDRMADAVAGIAAFLAEQVPALDTEEVHERAEDYEAELRALAVEVEETLAPIPAERRVIVTGHDVFGYFADRFDFDIVGVVVPGGGTHGAASAAELDHLVDDVEAAGVEVVFTDASSSSDLAETLADEAGGLEVVPLLTESLAPPGEEGDTYVDMVTVNASRIAAALAG